MTQSDWDDFGRALKIVLMVFVIGVCIVGVLFLCSCNIQAQTHSMMKSFPDSWKSCTDMKPIPGADDGSQTAICTDDDGQQYEIVYRSIHKACLPEVDAKDKRDGYQHFLCEEKWELMIRAARKAAK